MGIMLSMVARITDSEQFIAEANRQIDRLHADPVYGPLWQSIRGQLGRAKHKAGDPTKDAAALFETVNASGEYILLSSFPGAEHSLPSAQIMHRETERVFRVIVFLNNSFSLEEEKGV